MQERPRVKKLLAYEKEVNEGLPNGLGNYRVAQTHAAAEKYKYLAVTKRISGQRRQIELLISIAGLTESLRTVTKTNSEK
jgi:hypothetical protein